MPIKTLLEEKEKQKKDADKSSCKDKILLRHSKKILANHKVHKDGGTF